MYEQEGISDEHFAYLNNRLPPLGGSDKSSVQCLSDSEGVWNAHGTLIDNGPVSVLPLPNPIAEQPNDGLDESDWVHTHSISVSSRFAGWRARGFVLLVSLWH